MDILKKLANKKSKGELLVSPPAAGLQKPEKFLGGVVYEALQYTIRVLPQRLRDQYNGDVRHTEDLTVEGGAWHIMVVLTHMKTRAIITAETTIHNSDMKKATGVSLACSIGHKLGRKLVIAVKDAAKPPLPKTHTEAEGKGKVDGVFQDMADLVSTPQLKIDPDTLKPVPKPKPKPKPCKICGTTDDKYPEWEGTCNHRKRK